METLVNNTPLINNTLVKPCKCGTSMTQEDCKKEIVCGECFTIYRRKLNNKFLDAFSFIYDTIVVLYCSYNVIFYPVYEHYIFTLFVYLTTYFVQKYIHKYNEYTMCNYKKTSEKNIVDFVEDVIMCLDIFYLICISLWFLDYGFHPKLLFARLLEFLYHFTNLYNIVKTVNKFVWYCFYIIIIHNIRVVLLYIYPRFRDYTLDITIKTHYYVFIMCTIFTFFYFRVWL